MNGDSTARRPLATRRAHWPRALSRRLVAAGLRPNQISIASAVFAALAGAGMLGAFASGGVFRAFLLIAAALCIQLRLLCNLIDGLMAVEGGLLSKSGEVFNDLPDRVSDVILFLCAGYAVRHLEWAVELGWTAALLATLTAYVRVLGASAGAAQDFSGPMAKQHRMAVMTAACVVAALEPLWGWNGQTLIIALALIVLGCVATVIRRMVRVVRALESRS